MMGLCFVSSHGEDVISGVDWNVNIEKLISSFKRQANPGWEAQIVFYTSLSGKAKQLPVIEFDCFKINLLLPKEANFLVAYSTTLVIPPSGQLNMGPGLFLP